MAKPAKDMFPQLPSSDAPTSLTTAAATASAGGTGATAGAFDTAAHRDETITLVNNLKTRVGEIETRLKALGILV